MMFLFIFHTVTVIIIFKDVKLTKGFVQIDVVDEQEFQHCVCVPFYQCKEDFSGLIEDGINLIDIRELQAETKKALCAGDLDVCCQVECGKRRSVSSETTINNNSLNDDNVFGFRVLGENNNAEFAEFPWMLGILKGKIYRCGGSLIHPQVALTAAHCVTDEGPFKIRAGEWNWLKETEPVPHQERMAKKVIIHPQYNAASLQNDIALIILESPFRLTGTVSIACLPFRDLVTSGSKCVVSGWGKNSYKKGTYQPILKKLSLPIVPREKCLRWLQDARLGSLFMLHKSFICAGGELNKDTCKGDGGSPLVCPIPGQPSRYEQVGIVSWGLTCGMQNTPGVYVNTGIFRDWIDSIMLSQNFDINVYRY